jgi:hypothetical protein
VKSVVLVENGMLRHVDEELVRQLAAAKVVALAGADCAELFPEASKAETAKEYKVAALRPPAEYDVPADVPI